MNVLGLDIGSSSVKAAILRGDRPTGKIIHSPFATKHDGVRVEVEPKQMLKAVAGAIRQIGAAAKRADLVALSVMSPAWVAMDAAGKPLTPIVTHQDRRSVDVALELERRVGRERFLHLSGNRPIPGGISVTTWAWYLKNEPALIKNADLVGHLNTFLHRQITGARVTDPSNASFMGLYSTVDLGGWNRELCDTVGVPMSQLPEVLEADRIAGKITGPAARQLGLTEGTPVLTGIVDTSSAMLLSGARVGQLTNNSGSTDVLGICADRAIPHERLLTRALGVGRRWMSVSTIAAAGSSLDWTHNQLFADFSRTKFWQLVTRLARRESRGKAAGDSPAGTVCFEPYLAGDRTSVEQRQAAFKGLTLSSTRQHMLAAVVEALAQASAARLKLFGELGIPMRRRVMLTGGAQGGLADLLHRDWPGKWTFYVEKEATLRGLSCLTPRQR
jgi:sugar (pentulose or hexulose) kinase